MTESSRSDIIDSLKRNDCVIEKKRNTLRILHHIPNSVTVLGFSVTIRLAVYRTWFFFCCFASLLVSFPPNSQKGHLVCYWLERMRRRQFGELFGRRSNKVGSAAVDAAPYWLLLLLLLLLRLLRLLLHRFLLYLFPSFGFFFKVMNTTTLRPSRRTVRTCVRCLSQRSQWRHVLFLAAPCGNAMVPGFDRLTWTIFSNYDHSRVVHADY